MIQEKLRGCKKQLFTRKDLNEDFPIRGFALCSACESPLTASWSRGRNKKYPYYRCSSKSCQVSHKSIRKEALEAMFERSLISLTPS